MQSPPKVFDRALIARHLERRPPGHDDFVTRLALDDLGERLGAVTRTFERALIMAPDARVLPEAGRSGNGPFAFTRAATVLPTDGALLVDAEALELPFADYDLIVSIFDTQIVNDVVGFLARLRAHLRPDGLLLAALLGGATLTELRQAFLEADAALSGGATARVAPFIQLGDAGGLLQRAGLKLPVTDVETHTVRYRSPLALMQELKALGASNPLAERPTAPATKGLIVAASAAYEAIAGDPDGRVRASLEIIWMSGWAAHESQQQPLKPGSAEVSLRQVLGDKSRH
ncbi:MAG TPA: SAM-dependent methyltransferase [Devosiaceae bacterium]|nr:SAM-dependent methyltransferase [Devosiaceae bacterium]